MVVQLQEPEEVVVLVLLVTLLLQVVEVEAVVVGEE
jgi:hypothetical protein